MSLRNEPIMAYVLKTLSELKAKSKRPSTS